MLYIVSYDIVDNKKRTKLAKKLLNFGSRVQYSVFECNLNPKQTAEMKKVLVPIMDLEKDSLRIYRICDACRKEIETFGIRKSWDDSDENSTIVV